MVQEVVTREEFEGFLCNKQSSSKHTFACFNFSKNRIVIGDLNVD
jgi:hypothetical protein